MRPGIRPQLLVAMGVVLALAFVPLFLAVSSLTRAGFAAESADHARALGRAIAGHVAEARRHRDASELEPLLDAQLGHEVGAIAIHEADGRRALGRGDALDALPTTVEAGRELLQEAKGPRGPALVVVVPAERGPVAALLYVGAAATRATPILSLLALYAGLLGLTLLMLSYGVLTRIVVGPVERLRRAAARVAEGGRNLEVPKTGSRELALLGASLSHMTERLRADEDELRQRVAEIEAATEQLKRAQATLVRSERLASVGRLAAGLAHEIGNPISAILGFQELLLDGGLEPDETRDFLVRMRRETERVHRVLRDLLDFARPAVGAASDGREADAPQGSVADAVGHVTALVRPQKSFARIELRTAVEPGLPAVALDDERIEQVLLNLLLNAADALGDRPGHVSVAARVRDGAVEIAVEDDGGGVAAEVRARLFEPFVTTKDVGKGTGLGLAVCRGLVESAGGGITLEDGAAGARFVLTLPRAAAEEPEPSPSHP
ncbi:MAG: HAMP domain-containing protein [Myxococcales bacterium]|nr:HAMP domain-containing protein [Myxococcales bacterium]